MGWRGRCRCPVGFIPLSGQDTVVVSGEVSCDICRITWDTVATIGGLDGPGVDVVTWESRVAVDRLSRVLISVYFIPEVSVFDSKGTFLRTFGRSGEGPGEYFGISHVGPGPQCLHVIDLSSASTSST